MIRVLGCMTGTSCDALDAACLEFDETGHFEPLWEASRPYPKSLRDRVLKLQKPGTKESLKTWFELNRDLGAWYAKTLAEIIGKESKGAKRPHIIANHGQTIGHFPAKASKGFTCQFGDSTRIAQQTGITVVSSFREGDMAAGGQGAPLVPMFHHMLSKQLGGSGIAIHNIGGISNLTYIGPREQVIAFDTGPGNLWIDAATELATRGKMKFDRGGKLALSADLDWTAVQKVLNGKYFKQKPPKSTGRDDFPFSLLKSKTKTKGAELVATATWVTIESIARAYEEFILDQALPLHTVFICGGGANNLAIIEGLRARIPAIEFASLEEAGLDPQYIEAQAFAVFGWLALQGKPVGGVWTGATGFGPPAHIIPGANWSEVLRVLPDTPSPTARAQVTSTAIPS